MLEKVINILAEVTGLEKSKISAQSGLIADLELNSLDIVNAVMAFEEEFNIEIPDHKIKDFGTVQDIAEYLEHAGL